MHIHTHTHPPHHHPSITPHHSPTIAPPSLLSFLFPSCFSMLSLSLKKLVTCGVIRSYNLCVWNIWTDVKLLSAIPLLSLNIAGGHRGRGGRLPTKSPPRDPCKRTHGTLVVHRAHLSRSWWPPLSHIYIYLQLYTCIYIFSGYLLKGFSSQRITPMIQFLSSVISMGGPTWCHGPIRGNPL